MGNIEICFRRIYLGNIEIGFRRIYLGNIEICFRRKYFSGEVKQQEMRTSETERLEGRGKNMDCCRKIL